MVYGGNHNLWLNKNASRLSRLFNVAGFIVDGYNGIRYNAKNKQLVYLSLGLSALGTIIDFYISIKSASKLRKLSALGSLQSMGYAYSQVLKS